MKAQAGGDPVKSLLVRHISPRYKWLCVLSYGLSGVFAFLISLFLLVQFWQFTWLKLLVWLVPLTGWGWVARRLLQTETWRYRGRWLSAGFVPAQQGNWWRWYSLLAAACWLLAGTLLWRSIAWLAAWQYLGSQLTLQAVSVARAPAGYYEIGTGEWLGSSAAPGSDG